MRAAKSVVVAVIWSHFGGGAAAQGDSCATAQAAVVNGATPFGSAGFVVVDQTPSCGGGADPFDFWFSFVAPATGVAVATLCPSSQFAAGGSSTPADTALSAWTGACGALAQIACSTSSPTCGPGPAEASFAVVAGTTFYVRIVAEGGGPTSGTMALAVNVGPCPTPINDVPVQGTEVVANTVGPATYDNTCANDDLDPNAYGPPTPPKPPKPKRDVWVCFQPTADQCFRLTNLALFDTEIEIFVEETGSNGITYERQSGTAGETAAHAASGGVYVTSTVFCFCAGKKYWIALASVGPSGGLITLTMTSCNSTKFTVDQQLMKLEAIGDGSPGGSTGDGVHLFFTTTKGDYPQGWFFGIDIGLFELFQQLNLAATLGPLVQGTLDVDGKYEYFSFTAGPSPLSGVELFVTTVFFDPLTGQVALEICPAKIVFP